MSHPDEPMPAPPVPSTPLEAAPALAPAPPAPVAEAGTQDALPPVPHAVSALEAPLPSGAPYRLPAPPPTPEPATPEVYFGAPPRKPRPLIGPALSVFAVMLWTFVVVGQFASSWKLGIQVRSGEATIMVLLTTLVAFIASLRRSRIVVPPRSTFHFFWRAVGVALAAFVLFVFSLVAATAINSAMDVDFFVGVALALVSLLGAIFGARLTSPTPIERTPRQRALLVMLWVAGTVLTLVALLDLGANG